jgi:mRNA-degrading endonuclease RelE of RelBE toxin-antitoxin system
VTIHTLVWQPAAVAGLIRIRNVDPHAAKTIRSAVDALAREPRPDRSTPLGAEGLRRLRLGEARILYDINDSNQAVQILTIGQVHRRG